LRKPDDMAANTAKTTWVGLKFTSQKPLGHKPSQAAVCNTWPLVVYYPTVELHDNLAMLPKLSHKMYS